ncbi:MAG: hypothetical protein HKN11_21570, partial [Rhizobiales bacterium]|nr:hypothetical protein [Hyphomicrobiales bacterium]
SKLGAAYGAAFGMAALVSVGLIIVGWRMAQFVPVYEPPSWGRTVTFALVLVAFLGLGIFIFRGSLRQKLRAPLSIAVVFWGVGHLFANGDLASLILFGGLIAYGIAHFTIGAINGYRPSPEVRGGHDVLSLLGGAALYGLMIQLHGTIIGVPVFQLP